MSENIIEDNIISDKNILIDIQSTNSNTNFNILIYLKLNINDKNHNVLFKFIIKNLNEFSAKNIYFRIIENSIIIYPELISNHIYLKSFNNITKYLLKLLNNELLTLDKSFSDIDLSLPEKDLIFKLF
jgi:hypothetical protein